MQRPQRSAGMSAAPDSPTVAAAAAHQACTCGTACRKRGVRCVFLGWGGGGAHAWQAQHRAVVLTQQCRNTGSRRPCCKQQQGMEQNTSTGNTPPPQVQSPVWPKVQHGVCLRVVVHLSCMQRHLEPLLPCQLQCWQPGGPAAH
jgi:hypothetical protein